jgi:TPR repeat protein
MKKLVLPALAGALLMGCPIHAEVVTTKITALSEEIVALQTRSSTGDLDAKMRLGVAYWMGYGVKRDYDKAFKYISEAAEKEHPRSMMLLSKMYEQGVGTAIDEVKAGQLYELAKVAINSDKLAKNSDGVKMASHRKSHKPYRSYQGRVIPKPQKTYVQPIRSKSFN